MTFIKFSKGEVTDDTVAIANSGETIIHQGHWKIKTDGKIIENEKKLITVLNATDSRSKKKQVVSK